jgi:hypothetical protein
MSLAARLKKLERAAAQVSRRPCECPGHEQMEFRSVMADEPTPGPVYCPDCGRERRITWLVFKYEEPARCMRSSG